MTLRTLILLRHAKAETPGEIADFDRSLTDRGMSDADAAGSWLVDERLHPDLVLCSPARRTRQTWQAASLALAQGNSSHGALSPEVHYEDQLYYGGRTEVFDLLRAVSDTVRTILLVGHNPTVSEVSALLVPDDQWDGVTVELKTSGLAVHTGEVPWASSSPGGMRLARRHTARG
ncbi:phosphohistidine phosphatase [Actinoplanes sp. SE50]|uniref:SixA phosphatase family protein n=1 Tax=unclassified Actinoplanes TaxID=2626549 RepID=UPI00023ED154|nr:MULTISPECIES: histidine phosphatase family protein [unclassified Actinoplanes]AEV81083.1 2,3-bisphosphoglycerate-dependent phosphoglycerate mutase [Actinoplanes sp. SE50/110]ATO79484.1 phosphohistidine phosphatase [Actinoplanes sp. SE50]SLL96884.1 phosphohistidine phosphatase [Actinoplanes sp. SE50/110]